MAKKRKNSLPRAFQRPQQAPVLYGETMLDRFQSLIRARRTLTVPMISRFLRDEEARIGGDPNEEQTVEFVEFLRYVHSEYGEPVITRLVNSCPQLPTFIAAYSKYMRPERTADDRERTRIQIINLVNYLISIPDYVCLIVESDPDRERNIYELHPNRSPAEQRQVFQMLRDIAIVFVQNRGRMLVTIKPETGKPILQGFVCLLPGIMMKCPMNVLEYSMKEEYLKDYHLEMPNMDLDRKPAHFIQLPDDPDPKA